MSKAPLKEWMASRVGARVIGIVTVVALIGMVELAIRAGIVNRFIVPLPSEIIVAIPRIIVEENVLHRFWQTTQEVLWASLLLAGVGIPLGALLRRFRIVRLACETWVARRSAPVVLMYPLFLVVFGRSATTIVMIGFAAGLPPVILKTVEGLAGTRKVLIDVGRSPAHRSQQFWTNPAAGGAAVDVRGVASGPDLRDDQHRRGEFRSTSVAWASSSTRLPNATTCPAPMARSASLS